MADSSSAATGGMLVVLGIVVAIGLGVLVFKGDLFHKSNEVKIELPNVSVTK